MQSIIIPQPDDWHLHLRDGDALSTTVPTTASLFARAIVMPNLIEPVTTVAQAASYRERIMRHVPYGCHFQPLMTLYLHDLMPPSEIVHAKASGFIHGCKLYPAGATTHSDRGVHRLESIYPVLEKMQQVNMPLLVHGEVTAAEIDIFDREAVFIETTLAPLAEQFPELKIVFEHITTAAAVHFVDQSTTRIAATITAHHLLYNRNTLLAGGIKPHYYCLPILKTEQDRLALIRAATSGSGKYFLGTDSAPHSIQHKESACGCAGIYSAPCALEAYAMVFETHDQLDKLADFAARFGAEFYDLPINSGRVRLDPVPWRMPQQLSYAEQNIKPMCAGETLSWQATLLTEV
jgi:dihydroorotase